VLESGPLEPDDLLPVLTEMLDLVEQKTGVHITDTALTPRYAIELSVALPVSTGRRGP
jgi:hypothetical protein